ncbi:MAG: hypothetical protein COV45_03705 [Deltaproteobacteria bacterium CG11_big_fil_rev_8_21_14_0_20_47_16]|nr:MAG: hypothetical protein COV45_03705 [Deltaproteobacteria bacterium CG11_big_fil_rev_8_21_14_0_20_47_16]
MSADAAHSLTLPDTGDVVNGRYRILNKLGKGGMGQVFKVHDSTLQKDLALKYLIVPKDKPHALDRFKSEFAKLAQFPHPNISAVYDFGFDADHDLHFFTTELIDGRTFFEGTRGLDPLAIEALIVQTLRALEYLHNHHLMHFDIKPGNVLITEASDGKLVAKVIDFGVADFGSKGRLVGTPSYMAPEMTRREIPDQRADLYSLGVMWYQVLAGLPDSPFRGGAREVTFMNHQTMTLPPLHKVHHEVPGYVDHIIARLLEKRTEERFPYAAAVISEINLHKSKRADRYDVETRETRQSYIPTAARFVGREAALAQLRNFLQAHMLHADDSAQTSDGETVDMVWITGDKGMGKSRLLGEARHTAQLNGFAIAGAEASDPASWDNLRVAIHKAMEHPSEPALLWVDSFGTLNQDSAAKPLLDDIAKLQDFLVSAKGLGAGPLRICLVIAARDLPKSVQSQEVLQLPLKSFTDKELEDYILSVTGFETTPKGFVTEMMRHTEGNPYFVTELMKTLIDQNILFDSVGRWKATTFEDLGVDFSAIRVPGSLADAISLEYNQLSSPEQELLGLLAVWNAAATAQQLEAVLNHPLNSATPIRLLKKGWIDMDLENASMVIPNPNRRAAVETLLSATHREHLHHAIAQVLGNEEGVDPELLHWHIANGSDPKRSTESLWILAEHYVATDRPLVAISTLLKLISKLPAPTNKHDGDKYIQANLMLARTYRAIRRFDETMVLLQKIEHELQAAGNHDILHARIWEEMAITDIKQGHFKDADRACMRGLQLLKKHPENRVQLLRTENYLGQVFLASSAVDRAIELFRRTRDEAAQLPTDERLQVTNNELCHALFQKGDYAGVVSEATHDLVFYEGTLKMRQIYLLMANAYRNLRKNQKARSVFEKGIDLARSKHDSEYLFYNYQGLGGLYSDMGEYEEGVRQYERALELAGRLGDPAQSVAIKTNLGILHMKLGRQDIAERELSAVIDYMRQHPPSSALAQMYACRAHLELGDMYVKASRFPDAREHLDQAETYVRKYANCGPLLFSIQLTRAEMHRDMGDKPGAKKLIAGLRKIASTPEEIHHLDITETTMEDQE